MLSGKRPFTGAVAGGHRFGASPRRARAPRPCGAGNSSGPRGNRHPVPRETAGGPVRHGARPRDRSSKHLERPAAGLEVGREAAARAPTADRCRGRLVAAAVLVVLAAVAISFKWPRTSGKKHIRDEELGSPAPAHEHSRGGKREPALSPDGTLVAYSSNASGKRRHLGCRLEARASPSASPTAKERTEAGLVPGRAHHRLRVDEGGPYFPLEDLASGGAAPRSSSRTAICPPSPPTVRSSLSAARGPSGRTRIFVAPVSDPGRAVQLSGEEGGDRNHRDPAFSPDGRTLCYSAGGDLWLVPFRGGTARQLTRDDARQTRSRSSARTGPPSSSLRIAGTRGRSSG